jgi:O-antigen/teichoic acid export membrane protein
MLAALVVGSGFSWLAAREVASQGLTDETKHRFRAAWVANVSFGLLIFAGLWLGYAMDWLPLGPAYRAIIPLVGLTALLLAARSVVNGAAQGLFRFGAVAINQVGEVAIKVVFGLILVAMGVSVAGVMAAFALGAAAALLHSLWIVHPAKLWRGGNWFDRQVIKDTAPLFIGMLGPALMLNLDILGLKLLSPPGQGDELAGYYQAAVILSRLPVFIARSVVIVIFAYVAGVTVHNIADDRKQLTNYAHIALRAWFRLLLPISLVLAIAPGSVLKLFFPERYLIAAPPLRIAAIGAALLALGTLLIGITQASKMKGFSVSAAALATVAQLIILVWLVPSQGALGAAISLIVAGGIILAGQLYTFLPFHFPSVQDLITALLPLFSLIAVLILLPDYNRPTAFARLAVAGLVYVLVIAALLYPRFMSNRTLLELPRSPSRLASQLVSVLVGN